MNFFSRMEPREKYFLLAGIGCAVFFVMYFLIGSFGSSDGHSQAKLEKLKRDRAELGELLEKFDQAYTAVGRIDQKLLATPAEFDLYDHIGQLVENANIRDFIKKMDPGEGAGTDFFTETYVDINIQGIDQDRLVRFLSSIDSSEEFLRISQLTIKRREIDEANLDVYPLRVSVYRVKEAL